MSVTLVSELYQKYLVGGFYPLNINIDELKLQLLNISRFKDGCTIENG